MSSYAWMVVGADRAFRPWCITTVCGHSTVSMPELVGIDEGAKNVIHQAREGAITLLWVFSELGFLVAERGKSLYFRQTLLQMEQQDE